MDDLLYPNGALTGNDGWIDSSIGSPTFQVAAFTITTTDPGGNANEQPTALVGADFSLPWELDLTINAVDDPGNSKDLEVIVGDTANRFWVILLVDNSGIGASGGMEVTLIDPDGNSGNFSGGVPNGLPIIMPNGVTVMLRFVFDGTSLLCFVDSYCLGGLPFNNLNSVSTNHLQLYINAFDTTKSYTISQIKFRGQT